MDQWRSKFSESFSLDRYWSIECSSLLRFVHRTVRAAPVFGSDGSLGKVIFNIFEHCFDRREWFRFRFRFLKSGSNGSGSSFGSWENGTDGSGFRF